MERSCSPPALTVGVCRNMPPRASFKNGTEAEAVLLQYKPESPGGFDEWPRLIDQAFACGPGGVVSDTWLKHQHPNVPDMLVELIRSADTVTERLLEGRACLCCHAERHPDPTTTITKDLYLDKASFEPRRQTTVVVQNGTTVKSNIEDYQLEHLATDEGIEWRLDPAKLMK